MNDIDERLNRLSDYLRRAVSELRRIDEATKGVTQDDDIGGPNCTSHVRSIAADLDRLEGLWPEVVARL